MGKETARELARMGAEVILGCQQRGPPRTRRTGRRGRRSRRPANSRMQGSRICPPLPAYQGAQPSSLVSAESAPVAHDRRRPRRVIAMATEGSSPTGRTCRRARDRLRPIHEHRPAHCGLRGKPEAAIPLACPAGRCINSIRYPPGSVSQWRQWACATFRELPAGLVPAAVSEPANMPTRADPCFTNVLRIRGHRQPALLTGGALLRGHHDPGSRAARG
jgi:hypothetical protein